jgi:hypothetical protein
VVLRRLCGDFVRILVRVCLNMTVPTVFKGEGETKTGSGSGGGSESKGDRQNFYKKVSQSGSDRERENEGEGLSNASNRSSNSTVRALEKRDSKDLKRVLSGDTHMPPRSMDLTPVPLQVHGRAPRIVLYSRGNTGHGRSMQVD